MASTVVEICNSALAKVGAARILTLDDDSEEARLCKALYPVLRDKLLRSHPWRFALKRVELAALSDTPEFDYDYQFQLPLDCLRVLNIDSPEEAWKQEGDVILCNISTLKILYIFKLEDASKFDVNFAEVLAYLLAMEVCFPLTQSSARASELSKMMEQELKTARSYSAQIGSVERVEADSWLTTRY